MDHFAQHYVQYQIRNAVNHHHYMEICQNHQEFSELVLSARETPSNGKDK